MGDATPHSKCCKNWTEPNSPKLIDAYKQVQLDKLGKAASDYPPFTLHMDLDRTGVINDKITVRFNKLSPEA